MLTGPFGVSRALMSFLLFTDLQSEHVSLPGKRFWLPRMNSGFCSDGVCFDASSSLQQPVPPSPACGLLPPAHPIPSSRAAPYQGPPAQHPCSKPSAHPPSLLLQEGKLQVFLRQPGPQGRVALQGTGWDL